VSDLRRQAVSFRLAHGDIRNIKRFAKRLGVRDSDIVRFAIRSTFSRLAPLCDPAIRGRSLVPVLAEAGDELIRHFELDAFQLDALVNDQVAPEDQVERDDIVLLAMVSLRQDYLRMRLNEDGQASTKMSADSLRRYLYDKYIYVDRNARRTAAPAEPADEAERVNGTAPQPAMSSR
jgi:hypothetical protein